MLPITSILDEMIELELNVDRILYWLKFHIEISFVLLYGSMMKHNMELSIQSAHTKHNTHPYRYPCSCAYANAFLKGNKLFLFLLIDSECKADAITSKADSISFVP